MAQRFPIRFDSAYRVLSSILFLVPSASYLEIANGRVHARMGWVFRTVFPLASVTGTSLFGGRTLSRGVHGWSGRWLVNGSEAGIVAIAIAPAARAWVLGFPVRLLQLMVSMDDPEGLRQALGRGRGAGP
jgi:hypothetical protein